MREELDFSKAITDIQDIFIRGEWYDFIYDFIGNHTNISMIFAHNFDGF
jgi:hypothetical protein